VLKHIRTRFLPGQTIPDLSGADDLLGLSGEVTPGLLPFDASLAPFGVGVGKTWLGADGGGMEFLEWLMKGDDLNNLVPGWYKNILRKSFLGSEILRSWF
jgi:hypothetical protein